WKWPTTCASMAGLYPASAPAAIPPSTSTTSSPASPWSAPSTWWWCRWCPSSCSPVQVQPPAGRDRRLLRLRSHLVSERLGGDLLLRRHLAADRRGCGHGHRAAG